MKFAPKKTTSETTTSGTTAEATSGITDPTVADATASVPETDTTDPVATPSVSGLTGLLSSRSRVLLAAMAILATGTVTGFTVGKSSPSLQGNKALVANEILAPEQSAPELVAAALDAAESYHAVNSTFVGFTMPNVSTASSASVFLAASTLDGVCAFSKIVDGVRFEVGTDTTGETCTPATMEAAQKMLDDLASSTNLSAASALGASISAVAEAAVLYASISFDATGRPSLYGLVDLQVPNTKVLGVARDGQTATVQVEADGLCSVVKVSATPTATPPSEPC